MRSASSSCRHPGDGVGRVGHHGVGLHPHRLAGRHPAQLGMSAGSGRDPVSLYLRSVRDRRSPAPGPSATTMWSVPPEARATSMARRTARAAPSESAAPTTTFSNMLQAPPCAAAVSPPPGPSGMARRIGASAARRSEVTHRGAHQHGHIGRLGQLLADPSTEAASRHAPRVEAEDDQVGAEGRGRLGDTADHLVVACAPGRPAHRELVRQPTPPPAHVGDDLAPSRRDDSSVN